MDLKKIQNLSSQRLLEIVGENESREKEGEVPGRVNRIN